MIGTILGNRYELLEKIGEGGMAEVYKAKCHILNRYVAVKVLKREFANNEDFVSRFQAEAKAAGSLSDSHIVNIYDVGSQENVNYIVMEYINGKTLKEVISEEGTINSITAIEIAIQIATALDCAHKNNIVHRDIKPHNIMITLDGNVKVTDFGIARVSNFSTITNTSKVIGTAHYFSPEQARGAIVDCRSDLYSLGILIYEMVTGKVPYDADTPVSIALKHIQETVIPPIKINSTIPQSLNNLILKCMEKEPVKRYQNALELISDLKAIKYNKDVNIRINNYDNEYTRVMDAIDAKNIKKAMLSTKEGPYDKYNYDEEEDEEEEDEDDVENKKRNRKTKRNGGRNRKRLAIITSSVVIILAMVGIITNIFFTKKFSNKNIVIPTIVGMKKDEAKKIVEDKGLKFIVSSIETSDKPEDEVLTCIPEEGTKVKPKSEVRVTISAGNKDVSVPEVINLDIVTAKDKILNTQLNIGEITHEDSDTFEKNAVIKQFPEPGTKIKSGEKIDLVISNGSESGRVSVPNLADKGISEAKSILESLNLKLGDTREVSTNDKTKDGKIFNQSLAPRSKVKEETEIKVSFYKYKEGNTLP